MKYVERLAIRYGLVASGNDTRLLVFSFPLSIFSAVSFARILASNDLFCGSYDASNVFFRPSSKYDRYHRIHVCKN